MFQKNKYAWVKLATYQTLSKLDMWIYFTCKLLTYERHLKNMMCCFQLIRKDKILGPISKRKCVKLNVLGLLMQFWGKVLYNIWFVTKRIYFQLWIFSIFSVTHEENMKDHGTLPWKYSRMIDTNLTKRLTMMIIWLGQFR